MKFIRHVLLLLIMAVATAHADPIRIVTNLAVGSSPDVVVRKMSDQLSRLWQVPVIIDNRPGAGGIIALEYFLNARDPNMIYMSDFGAYTIMPILFDREQQVKQLRTIWPTFDNIWAITVPAHVRTWNEFQDLLKKNPYYGSWGTGSSGHLCGHELSNKLGVTATHVAYKDYGSMYADLINGNLTFVCGGLGSAKSYYQAGKLNFVAITGNKRDRNFKTVPTIDEILGNKFKVARGQITFFTHQGTPELQRKKLENGIRTALSDPGITTTLELYSGYLWEGTNVDEFEKIRWHEYDTYKRLITDMNISVK